MANCIDFFNEIKVLGEGNGLDLTSHEGDVFTMFKGKCGLKFQALGLSEQVNQGVSEERLKDCAAVHMKYIMRSFNDGYGVTEWLSR